MYAASRFASSSGPARHIIDRRKDQSIDDVIDRTSTGQAWSLSVAIDMYTEVTAHAHNGEVKQPLTDTRVFL